MSPHGARWRAQHTLDGRRVSLGVYATREEAEAVLRAARVRLASADGPARGVTVADWGDAVLDRRERAGLRDVDTERSRWRVHVRGSRLGDLLVREVHRADVERWLERLMLSDAKPGHGQMRRARRVSRSTAQSAMVILRVVLEDAVRRGVATSNPARDVELPRSQGRTHEPWTYLHPHEQQQLLAACESWQRPLVAFALFTGLRQGEQWALRREDVSLTARFVTVRFGAPGLPTKSGRIRRVPLLPEALSAARAASAVCAHDLLFPSRLGDARSKGEPSWWSAVVARAAVGRPVRWHDLRHTCASSLVAGWWGRVWRLEEVRAMLGHSSITVTERYAHLAGTILERAAAEHVSAHGAHTPHAGPITDPAGNVGSHLRDLNSRPTVYEGVDGEGSHRIQRGESAHVWALRFLLAARVGSDDEAMEAAAALGVDVTAPTWRAAATREAERVLAEAHQRPRGRRA